ncbi:MAG: hypothetical protein E6H63_10280 [Betaproteobacteria bacterium]|nr:MAG: hypothetical protein E6H63_10280 [Betaproteobacteria bacterium]
MRNCTGQLATLAEGFQYRPIDSNVGTARAPFAGRPELGVGVGVGLGVGEGVGLGVGEGVGLGVGEGVGLGVAVAFCTVTSFTSV